MKKQFSKMGNSRFNLLSKLAQGLAMLFFLLFVSQSAQAQSTATGGVLPPKSEVRAAADALGITVYDFNSWNLNVVRDVVRLTLDQTTGTDPISNFKRAYYGVILDQMGFDVAPQIVTVLGLEIAKNKLGHSAITNDVMRSTYNSLVSSF